MTQTATALFQFWSSFGIPAYPDDAVPDNAEYPYITYELIEPYWMQEVAMSARVWYRSRSFVEISAKLDEISEVLDTGASVKTDSGSIKLFWDNNKIQFQPYDIDPDVKVAYLRYILAAHTH